MLLIDTLDSNIAPHRVPVDRAVVRHHLLGCLELEFLGSPSVLKISVPAIRSPLSSTITKSCGAPSRFVHRTRYVFPAVSASGGFVVSAIAAGEIPFHPPVTPSSSKILRTSSGPPVSGSVSARSLVSVSSPSATQPARPTTLTAPIPVSTVRRLSLSGSVMCLIQTQYSYQFHIVHHRSCNAPIVSQKHQTGVTLGTKLGESLAGVRQMFNYSTGIDSDGEIPCTKECPTGSADAQF